ncbi:MAG: SRPBCC family protein [Intrasporangium sp.]|uniref:SRPBCC family protein n=1 Tax=Intrasporangium sp. TaxID=1925024 RepID=UPI00264788EB|nr:SRPBCC family protein [Intrasporangium sp.]MDN5795621.1 SRPBCC family protein [Intrasporangium sp.]
MELQHSFTVPAPVETAWDLFMDLDRVGGCFPGATVTDATDDGFAGTVKVKLGPIALLYAGSGTFLERDEQAGRAVIEAKGKDKRGNGTAGATVTIQLSEDGEGTRADVTTDLAVTGKPAQFGRGVMQDVSDKLLGQFVTCIEHQFATVGEGPGADGQPAPAAAATSSPTEQLGDSSVGEGSIAVTEQQGGGESAATVGPAQPPTTGEAGAAGPTAAYQPGRDDAIDLGATVLPVLVRRYAGLGVAALVGLLVGWLIGRRGSRD